MRPVHDDVLLHRQNAVTLASAHTLLKTLVLACGGVPETTGTMDSMAATLENMGFSGLWRSCSMGSVDDIQRESLEPTERLIEVSPMP